MNESEKLIIDACLSDTEKIPLLINELDSSDFEDYRLGKAFDAIKMLFSSGKAVDTITVSEQCKKLFDPSVLTGIAGNTCWYGSDLNSHAQRIRDNGNRKRLRIMLQKSMKTVDDKDKSFDEIAGEISGGFFSILSESGKKKERNLPDEILDLYQQRKQDRLDGKTYSGIPSGFERLDKITGGWQPGTLIIIGGRSSHGKSTLALDFFYRCGLKNIPCLFLTLEQQSSDIYLYLIQKHMGIHPIQIKLGDLSTIEEGNLEAAAAQLKKYPFYVEDSASWLTDINLKIRAMVLSKAVKLVVVDYLQLIENPVKEPRHLQIGGISRALKRLAMDMNISIIALTQLNKDPEGRGGKIHLADVRESESISHDADQVLFLHRPSLYGDHESDYLELAKNRHGDRITEVYVKWDKECNQYKEK